MTEAFKQRRLADLAREAVATFKYNGFKSRREQQLAECAKRIEEAEQKIQDLVMEAAMRGQEQVRLLTIDGSCLVDRSDRVHHRDMHIACEQCHGLVNSLRAEGFDTVLNEDKNSYYLQISWREKETA